ncbi:PREDICTED: protein TIC 40, chloroplastic isoform X2 [Ipomoea nil]|uniref:protein TIC 40, chloroplastic isoform X2 n=1 Tax=Ipomoea nil TaxID=35883 RepID=UPI000901EA4F|nr:PREDICTED: protein TIC 40, chloroplastic isoform X2 [Ipomoea nil]
MVSLAMAASSSCCPQLVLGLSPNNGKPIFGLPVLPRKSTKMIGITRLKTSFSTVSYFQDPRITKTILMKRLGRDCFASTSSGSQQTSSVGVSPQFTASPPSSNLGSPLFWIGVGVALSALFSWAARTLKNYAMQQAFKTMMGQANTQNNQFGNAPFSPGSPFPFPFPPPPPPTSGPASSFPSYPTASSEATPSPSSVSQPVTVDVSATKVNEPPTPDVKDEKEVEEKPKKTAFVDVSPEGTFKRSDFENFKDITVTEPSNLNKAAENGTASASASGSGPTQSSPAGKPNPPMTVEALEKMMEDPTVQKMVYPYLPDEMRNPETFKWMLQNPHYRQQLQDMLNNMGGSPEWDNRMMDTLKNFDLSSPEVKQQFDQIGLSPEEVISKIMANPDIAMAFQNPRIQAAIMDVSQNPYNIGKYQADKEVMDVFNKIAELFPGAKP